jgi:integrase/recombinase XerC
MENREILENLVISSIKKLDQVLLSKAYTYILQLSPSYRDINNIGKEDLLKKFLAGKINMSKNTEKSYTSVLARFLNQTYPNIDKDSVLAYIKKEKERWSTNTQRRNYIFIKNFLGHLYRDGFLLEDLSGSVLVPKKIKVEKYIPNDSDIASFFRSLNELYGNDDERLRFSTIFSVYTKTGLRLNELIGLDYKDADFNNRRIYLNQTKNHDKDYVSMDGQLVDIISNYINRFGINGGSLMRGKGKKRINKNVITNNLKRIVRKAGLPEGFTIHAFRRYFIDKQRRSKTDLFVLKEIARHKDVNTTYGYVRVDEEEKRAAIANIRLAV